jgi:hypothetical protein
MVACVRMTRVVGAESHHWNCGIRSSVLYLMHTQHTFHDDMFFSSTALFLSPQVLHNLPTLVSFPFLCSCNYFPVFPSDVSAVSAVSAVTALVCIKPVNAVRWHVQLH